MAFQVRSKNVGCLFSSVNFCSLPTSRSRRVSGLHAACSEGISVASLKSTCSMFGDTRSEFGEYPQRIAWVFAACYRRSLRHIPKDPRSELPEVFPACLRRSSQGVSVLPVLYFWVVRSTVLKRSSMERHRIQGVAAIGFLVHAESFGAALNL